MGKKHFTDEQIAFALLAGGVGHFGARSFASSASASRLFTDGRSGSQGPASLSCDGFES